MDDLTPRESEAAASLLENEALTDNLDDTTAKTLLEWGLAYVKAAVARTREEGDDEEHLQDQLQATRRLLRLVNNHFDQARLAEWAADPPQRTAATLALLPKLVELATLATGRPAALPGSEQALTAVAQGLAQAPTPAAFVAGLRQFIDQQATATPAPEATRPDEPTAHDLEEGGAVAQATTDLTSLQQVPDER